MRIMFCNPVVQASLLFGLVVSSVQADDWPQWGGPKRDIVWRETGIVKKLPAGRRPQSLLPRMWSTPIGDGYSGPAVADGRVFITDRQKQKGTERVWETLKVTGDGRWWNAFLIPHEDRYFIHNEQGDLIIAELSPQGYKEISRAKLVQATRRLGSQGRTIVWSHPAFAMKSVFARNDKEIVRVNLAAE